MSNLFAGFGEIVKEKIVESPITSSDDKKLVNFICILNPSVIAHARYVMCCKASVIFQIFGIIEIIPSKYVPRFSCQYPQIFVQNVPSFCRVSSNIISRTRLLNIVQNLSSYEIIKTAFTEATLYCKVRSIALTTCIN